MLSEHVYCVAVAFKMTEQIEQWICIKFCVKFKHFSTETIQMIQKAAAMGNWWLAASSGKCARSCIRSHAVFWWLNSKHPGDSALHPPPHCSDLMPCEFWLFPKLKSPLKENRFQTVDEIQENTTGRLMAIGRTVWGPEVPTLKETEVSLSYVQCFLYLLQ